ncbi:MAG: type IV secretion system protein VirB11 [Candidatus Aenigmatarchaeota archaeon]|nr:MAG: type IV secretion system protein VirB11 [Candidatus Aenigmarchaeota archaeon]
MRIKVIKKATKKLPKKNVLMVASIVKKLRRGYIASKKKQEMEKGIGIPGQFFYQPKIYTKYEKIISERVKESEKTEKAKKIEGVEIPTKIKPLGFTPVVSEEKFELQNIRITYNLIPRFPKRGEKIFAYAYIYWDRNQKELVYKVIEPSITPSDIELIENIKRELEERLDVDFVKIGEIKAKEILRQEIQNILYTVQEVQFDDEKKSVLTYYIEKDILGLGKIQPLMEDPNIEDISCDGVGIPVYIYHRDPRIGSIKTNIVFSTKDELDSFVIRLAQKCRKTISIAEPLLDASLPDGSRVQATLGTDIARKGSNFTIRKFTEQPLTPTHMLRFGTLNSMQLAYLWLAVENGQSVLISGGTATGKTSLLNALSLFIKPSLKIVSIEDTPELRLPHPHWVPEVARSPLSIEGRKGEVSLFDLLKSSLRQRPDYIIMGEVRGKEAFVLFQQMATGHPSIATIHAASISQLIDRLTTPPISLPPTLLENINIIVFLTLARIRENYVRRADNILEIAGVKDGNPVTNSVFEWVPVSDSFEIKGKSLVLKNIAKKLGVTEATIQEELLRRKQILEWMLEQEIFDYKEVAKIITSYYSNPDAVLESIME